VKRILVIEDEAQHVQLVKIRLEIRGFQVEAAQTGADGIALAARCAPDLVLLDLLLPDMTAEQTLAGLRLAFGGRMVPVVAFTALDTHELDRRRLGELVSGYIQKPYETAELFSVIEKHL
jgi:DNA-binding response OmpR family regulator